MNISTAENINRDLINLIKHYLAAGRPIPAGGYLVAMTPANIKNLTYYIYKYNINGDRYKYRGFKKYAGAFYARHVQQGAAVPLEIAAGVGRVPVRIVEYTDD